jgi:mono/diheme cytochrome c family protein
MALKIIPAAALAVGVASSPAWAMAPGDPNAGAAMAEKWCVSCHDAGVGDTAVDAAPPFATIAADTELTDSGLRSFLTVPHGQMEHFSFTPREIDNLVSYIRSLAPES